MADATLNTPGWTFLHWLGDATGTNPTATVTNRPFHHYGFTFNPASFASAACRRSKVRKSADLTARAAASAAFCSSALAV